MALLIQARHLFYGISMLDKFKGTGWKKFFLIFGMCDETFSVNYTAKIPEGVDKGWFMLWVTFLNQFYWVSAATTGGLIGSLLKFDTSGISFVMTAMFVVIFLEQWLKEKNHVSSLMGIAVSVICLICFRADSFMLPTMAIIVLLLALSRKKILLFSAVVFFPFYRYVLFSQYHTLSRKKLTISSILHRPAFPFFAKIYISFFKIFFMYSRYPSSSMRKSQLLSVKICFRFSVTISYILFAFF